MKRYLTKRVNNNKIIAMKPLALIYCFIICSHLMSHGQIPNTNQHIKITAFSFRGTFDKMYSFNIDIFRRENDVKIIYSVIDSNIAKVINTIITDNYSIHLFYHGADSIATKYGFYKRDSVLFSLFNDVDYKNLVDSFFIKNTTYFENKAHGIIYNGGTSFKFIFEENGLLVKRIFAISPNKIDYPFLEILIKKTFGLYKPNLNGFLTRDNTNWYYPVK